jgi:hypothetical protein
MRVGVAVAGLLMLAASGQAQVRFDERVDVARVLIDARVVDGHGRPCRGLNAADFSVEIDGKPALLQSATWIGLSAPQDTDRADEDAAAVHQAGVGPAGRRIVFFVQWSLEPCASWRDAGRRHPLRATAPDGHRTGVAGRQSGQQARSLGQHA